MRFRAGGVCFSCGENERKSEYFVGMHGSGLRTFAKILYERFRFFLAAVSGRVACVLVPMDRGCILL